MTEPAVPRRARFRCGDQVQTVGPSARRREEKTGIVTDVLGSAENVIYRYRVTFADGNAETFFGFELEPLES
jgi:hypothetical protein